MDAEVYFAQVGSKTTYYILHWILSMVRNREFISLLLYFLSIWYCFVTVFYVLCLFCKELGESLYRHLSRPRGR